MLTENMYPKMKFLAMPLVWGTNRIYAPAWALRIHERLNSFRVQNPTTKQRRCVTCVEEDGRLRNTLVR